MLRFLQVQENKPIKIMVAGEDMKRGAVVSEDFTDDTLENATGLGTYLVDVPKNYEGINAVIDPMDGDFENIKEGQKVLRVPAYIGERYATTEITATGLVKGDPLVASNGLFVKAGTSAAYKWVYKGTYADPSVSGSHIVECVELGTTGA